MTLSGLHHRVLDRALDAAAVLACVCLVFQVVSITIDVSIRYFFGAEIKAVISLNEWSLLYIAFLGAGWLQRETGHVRVDIVLNFLGPRALLAADLFGIALGIGTCLVLTGFGAAITWEKFASGEYDFFKIENVPIWLVYLIIPVGGFLWLLQLLREVAHLASEQSLKRAARETDL